MKIDWAKKLSSRKFWLAVAAFVTSLIAVFGGSEAVAVQVAGLITAAGSIIAYCLAEGFADGGSRITAEEIRALVEELINAKANSEAEETSDK